MYPWLVTNRINLLIALVLLPFVVWAVWVLIPPSIESLSIAELKTKAPDMDQAILDRSKLIPYQLIQLHDAWLAEAIYWRHVHYVLACSSIALSALVASGSGLLTNTPRNVVAVLAAISTGLLTTITPYKTYEDFIGAWRIVNVAKLEFLMAKMTYDEFSGQLRLAENMLRESRQYQQPSTQHTEAPKPEASPKPEAARP